MDFESQTVLAALSEMHIVSRSSPPYCHRKVLVVIICIRHVLRLDLKYTYVGEQEKDVWDSVFISTNDVQDH